MTSQRSKSVLMKPVTKYLPIWGGSVALLAALVAGVAGLVNVNAAPPEKPVVAATTGNRVTGLMVGTPRRAPSPEPVSEPSLPNYSGTDRNTDNAFMSVSDRLMSARLAVVTGGITADESKILEKISAMYPEHNIRVQARAIRDLNRLLYGTAFSDCTETLNRLSELEWTPEIIAAGYRIADRDQVSETDRIRWLRRALTDSERIGDESGIIFFSQRLAELSCDPITLRRVAWLLRRHGRYADAAQAYLTLAGKNTHDAMARREAILAAADCELKIGRSADVRRIATSVTDMELKAELLVKLAGDALAKQRPTRAARLYDAAIKIASPIKSRYAKMVKATAAAGYARALMDSGRLCEARIALDVFIADAPSPKYAAPLKLALAKLQRMNGETTAALKLYKEVADNDYGTGLAGDAVYGLLKMQGETTDSGVGGF